MRPTSVLLPTLALTIALPTAARAQAPVRNAALATNPAPAAPAVRAVTVPEGTEFSVVTTEVISSKTATEGDKISLKVDENVVVNGVTVIARGTAVRGVVSSVERAGRMGKGGKLSLRVESAMAVDGQRVPLRASKAKSGDDKMGSTVALTVLFGPIGLLKKGKDASYPEGTRITVYTDQALSVAAAPAGQ
jgi:hypothetical protein